MDQTVCLFTSGPLRAEVIEESTPRGFTYSVTVHRETDETGRSQRLFSGRGDELHDLRAILERAGQVIEFLLDGGDLRTVQRSRCAGTSVHLG